GLPLRQWLAEIVVQGMRRNSDRLSRYELSEIVLYLATHGHKSVAGFYEIAGEQLVAGAFFVRDDIVGQAHDLRMPVFPDPAQDRSQAGPHEGQPVAYDHEVG